MPIYEYVCQECKKVFETIRPMSQADVPIPCAVCGAKHTKRKLSLVCPIHRAVLAAGEIAPTVDINFIQGWKVCAR
jgi:putative FmdB family regulatory protein